MKLAVCVTKICLTSLFSSMLFLSIVYGQNKVAETSVTVVSRWNKDERKKLIVRESRQKNRDERISRDDMTGEVTLRILDVGEKGYTIEWTYNRITAESKDYDLLKKKIVKLFEGSRIIYRTDKMGVFEELVNWEDVKEYLKAALDKVEKEFGANDAVRAALVQFREKYASRQNIENQLGDIRSFHFPYGNTYALGETVISETHLPSLIGGEHVPAKLETQMTLLDPGRKYVKIVVKREADKKKLRKNLYEFIRKIGEQGGLPIPEESEIPLVTSADIGEYEIELDSGWVRRINQKGEMRLGQDSKNWTYEMTLVDIGEK